MKAGAAGVLPLFLRKLMNMCLQIFDKPFAGDGKAVDVLVSDGDGAVNGRVCRPQGDPVIGPVKDQFCQNTDPQSRLHHGHNRVIIMDRIQLKKWKLIYKRSFKS